MASRKVTATSQTLTAVEIPCCVCGTMIFPNAANQCGTCLAQDFDLKARLQRGPGGAEYCCTYQCRECRLFKKTDKHSEYCEPESPELLSICLKAIPALQSTVEPRLHLVDASWVWTEPHSMRWKVRLTVRTEIQNVTVQQRVIVELKNVFQQCSNCNREFTNRKWHALVQLRQRRTDNGPKKGLAALENALAKNKLIRKHVISIDAAKNGFDFYFLNLNYAQAFSSYLQKVGPMRVHTSKKLVSADVKSNTANMKYTVACDMVPLCRHDLVLLQKTSKSKLSGRLVLVNKVSSVLHLIDASPKREAIADSQMELSPDHYYKYEKLHNVLASENRLCKFIVLDVELCDTSHDEHNHDQYEGPKSGVEKYALADVTVARESDFGVNDTVYTVVTHLGNLIQSGDTVLGYDLVATMSGDWELEELLNNSFDIPDVVLVKKGASIGVEPEQEEPGEKAMTKKKQRRRRRKEGKVSRKLEESVARMGFLEDMEERMPNFSDELESDPALAEQLATLEREFSALDGKDKSDDVQPDSDNEEVR